MLDFNAEFFGATDINTQRGVYQRLRAPLFMYSSDAVNEGGKLTYERDLCLNGYKLEACNTYLSALNDIS